MKSCAIVFAASVIAVASGGALLAQNPPTPQPGAQPAAPGRGAPQRSRFDAWKTALPTPTGPMPVVREEPANLAEHTVFRPATLPAKPLPFVAFANGGCRNTPIEFTAFLTEVASHGYVIVAAGTNDVDFVSSNYERVMPNGKPVQRVAATVLTEAVDWAQRENARRGNPYFGKLDKRVAYVGQSCGSSQAIVASLDPRTTTTVILNGSNAYFGEDLRPLPNQSLAATPPMPGRLHAPIAYFMGGPQDTGYQPAETNFPKLQRLPIFYANLPVGHTGAYPAPDLRWSKAVVAWLDWQLKGDKQASKQFLGASCGLCTDPDWTVKSKNLGGK